MMKSLLLIISIVSCFYAAQTAPSLPSGADITALKILVHKDPEELTPEMSIIVGNIYHQGMGDLSVKRDDKKARKYYEWAVKNKLTMGSLVLANLCLGQNDQKCYIEQMEKVVKAKDPALSASAAFQFTQYWNNMGNTAKAFEVMNYTADVYDDDRAQFMVGFSILSGAYIPKGWSKKDGEFYMYQACTNPNKHEEVKIKCASSMSKKPK